MTLLARQSTRSPVFVISLALVALSVLVVALKFINPILYYVSERLAVRPIHDVPVMWDYWWPFYLICAGMLINRSRHATNLFLVLAGLRILWCVIALTLFFAHPDWSYLKLQWLFVEVATLLTMAGSSGYLLATNRREDAPLPGRVSSLTF